MPRRMAGLYVSQGKECVLSRGTITHFDGKELVLLDSIRAEMASTEFREEHWNLLNAYTNVALTV